MRKYSDFSALDIITFPKSGIQSYFDLKSDGSSSNKFRGILSTLGHWVSFYENQDEFFSGLRETFDESLNRSNITFENPKDYESARYDAESRKKDISYKVLLNLD